MPVRISTFCALAATALAVGGCISQPGAGGAGLNTWQRYALTQQARRDQVALQTPAVPEIAQQQPDQVAPRIRPERAPVQAVRVAGRMRALDCREILRNGRIPVPAECEPLRRSAARSPDDVTLRADPSRQDAGLTRGLNPTVGVPDGGLPPGVPDAPAPVGPGVGGPATVDAPSLNPVVPAPTTVAGIPPSTVPLNQTTLPPTPTQRLLFAPAPSTPPVLNRPPVPVVGNPSSAVRGVLNSVRGR